MSVYTTINISRKTAREIFLDRYVGEIPDRVLEEMLDEILEPNLFNAFVVADDAANSDFEARVAARKSSDRVLPLLHEISEELTLEAVRTRLRQGTNLLRCR